MSWLRDRLSYANVTATLALFIALGGTSYAVLRIDSSDVVNNSLRSRDLRNNSIRSQDVRDRTLRARDLRRDSLGGGAIKESALGRVPLAANSERVGAMTAEDLRVKCPPDTVGRAGVCIETSARAGAGFLDAINVCDQSSRRLPDMSELDRFARSNPVSAEGEWTSSVYLEATGASTFERLEALVIQGGGTVGHDRVNAPNPHPFRCVALPSN